MTVQKLTVTEEVTKEAYELGQGIEGIIGSVKKALADGWQPGTDLPQIVVESIGALAPAIQGVENLPEEAKTETEAFATGLIIPVKRSVFLLLKKPAS